MMRGSALAAALLIAGCSAPTSPSHDGGGNRGAAAAGAAKETGHRNPARPAAAPAAPAPAGGSPGERTAAAEAPSAGTSARDAADVVRHYYALIEAGRYAEARRLWGGDGEAAGRTEAEFAADFAAYRDTHAEIGAPGRIEGAAGSLYVEVPVQLSGHRRDGSPFRARATVTLRRVNDVPGSTAAQRRWHISKVAAGAEGRRI